MPFDPGFNMPSFQQYGFDKPLDFGNQKSSSGGGSWIGSAIGAVGNIASTALANYYAKQNATTAYRRQLEILQKQMDFSRDEAEKQRYASSLTNLVNQMKAQGLNLDLMYGSGTPSQGSMQSASTPGLGSVQPAQTFQTDFAGGLSHGADTAQERLINSQAELNRANARKANTDATRTESMLPYEQQLAESSKAVNDSVVVLNASTTNLNEQQVDYLKQQIAESGQRILNMQAEINKITSDITLNKSLTDLNNEQRTQLVRQIDALVKQTAANIVHMQHENKYLDALATESGARTTLTYTEAEDAVYQLAFEYGFDIPGRDGQNVLTNQKGNAYWRQFGIVSNARQLGVEYDLARNTQKMKEFEARWHAAAAPLREVVDVLGGIAGAFRDFGIGRNMFRGGAGVESDAVGSSSTGVPLPNTDNNNGLGPIYYEKDNSAPSYWYFLKNGQRIYTGNPDRYKKN